ncbi:MAG: zinc-ribbon domain-containing protein [archaeon]|nr:MAG: zinc-ribbon domain-containing protein [archaeon]
MSDPDSGRLSSIKTYLLVALIFNILSVVGLAIASLIFLLFLIIPVLGFIAVIPIVLLVLSLSVLNRVNQMRGAAERGDIAALKALNSVGWAVIGLLFAGIITGIMLLLANGSINELQGRGPAAAPDQSWVQSQGTGEMKFCPSCGTKIPKSAAFCPKCGTRQ